MFDLAPLLTPAIVLALPGGTLWGVIMGALLVVTAMKAITGPCFPHFIHAVADTGGAVSAIASTNRCLPKVV